MAVSARSGPNPEESWSPARLIPTSGIGGQPEQERRATSALLAVMRAVPEFGRALLAYTGAPGGRISTFTEVQLKDADGKVSIPDGAIVVERGKTRWRCLVEVKTGGALLEAEQIGRYLDLARLHDFQAVLTISNQIVAAPTESPVSVDARRLRRLTLWHLSWWRILTEAVLQHQHRGVSDPDQAWILGELIAYLDHERSGAGGFEDMGEHWVAVRDAARQGTLRASDRGVRDVAARWEQFIQYLCLGLRQDLGREVVALLPRRSEATARMEAAVKALVQTGKLEAAIRVPDAAGPLELEADLRSRQLTTGVEIQAPREGRPKTRVNWLLRQLREAPADLRIDVRFVAAKETTSLLLRDVAEHPERLLSPANPHREPRSFRLALSREMGAKRGKSPGSFVHATRQQTLDFYRQVVQGLHPWTASPPRLPEPAMEVGQASTAAPSVQTFEGEANADREEPGVDTA